MNRQDTYTVLLSTSYELPDRNLPLYGFSYQLNRNENGSVILYEHGHPTKIILWDKDGPELADLTEQMVKERIEEVLS